MPRELVPLLVGSFIIVAAFLAAGDVGALVLIGFQAGVVAVRVSMMMREARRRQPPSWMR